MKTKFITIFTTFLVTIWFQSKAQTTAMNFIRNDCNGNPRHLFADLNAGNAVIIEFFMTSCGSCTTAGQKLESMKSNLLLQYPGKIKSYAIAYNNSYSQSTINNWVTSNGFSAFPMDSGALQVAYYGGMGMPTIVIVAGASHQLLGSPYIGFSTSDTTVMASNIRTFFNTLTGVNEVISPVSELNLFPNPSSSELNVKFILKESSEVVIDILDLSGRLVVNLAKEKAQAGSNSCFYRTDMLATGSYLIRIRLNAFFSTQKLIIIK